MIKLEKPKLLVDAIALISELVTEVRIKLLEDGMSIVAVDPANVAMILFKIPKESFSQYEPATTLWGVNMEDLKKILKRAATTSTLILEQEDNQLKITILDRIKREFVLSLIDVETEDKDEPSLDFSATVELSSIDFKEAIEDCAVVADSCTLSVGEGFFVVEGSGSLNSARAQFSTDEAQISGLARSKFSLEYLMKFIKAGKFSEKVKLRFSEEYPLRLDFAGERMGMGFILAPRVEND